jgi:hypothetical protein
MLHKQHQKGHKLMTQRYGYSKGGLIHTYGAPPPFMDMNDESYRGTPPLPHMKEGGIVAPKEIKPKANYFQRKK